MHPPTHPFTVRARGSQAAATTPSSKCTAPTRLHGCGGRHKALSIPCPERWPKPRSCQDNGADISPAAAQKRPAFLVGFEPSRRNAAEPFLSGPAWGLQLSPVSVPSRRLAPKLCPVSLVAATRGKGQRVLCKALASAGVKVLTKQRAAVLAHSNTAGVSRPLAFTRNWA